MKKKVQKIIGKEAFELFYSDIFTSRWQVLKASLMQQTFHAELCYENCASYFLDPASVVAALCLPVSDSDKILDMCAAPGGKTLVLASNMNNDAALYANERSPSRKARLVNVIQESLPQDVSCRIKTTCSDATSWCKRESECYDSILLDAPCSSERHVLNDTKYLELWTPSRVKSICMEQWALLSCAYRLLKPKGFLLYATCALCPKENDETVLKLTKKFDNVRIISLHEVQAIFEQNAKSIKPYLKLPNDLSLDSIFAKAEQTECGLHILPDSSNGLGPLYFALITKK